MGQILVPDKYVFPLSRSLFLFPGGPITGLYRIRVAIVGAAVVWPIEEQAFLRLVPRSGYFTIFRSTYLLLVLFFYSPFIERITYHRLIPNIFSTIYYYLTLVVLAIPMMNSRDVL
ncbi:uncharacterized protein BO87DRAFT_207328 [Aspergillus neoniger CBS 115656]|uniref:Uncharacterized protein n=1 Tax=Aspergillus neoniger (strain CBS 115656) TaxID=1448310 RepID=A0A318YRY0_ASPNB|nr:hypothetical protein BO87DRAFT_207328 [Aspergillus neoniger CBS 115656]PYH37455.1 hypothetical protein BO87DRAFT_207328 [Aspergillus neoniger CBS 115656]